MPFWCPRQESNLRHTVRKPLLKGISGTWHLAPGTWHPAPGTRPPGLWRALACGASRVPKLRGTRSDAADRKRPISSDGVSNRPHEDEDEDRGPRAEGGGKREK